MTARIMDIRREMDERNEEEYIGSGRKTDSDRQNHDTIAWWIDNHYSGWA